MTLRLRLALVVAASALAACSDHVEGNGVFAERTYQLPAFDRAAIGMPACRECEPLRASLFPGHAPASVVLSGDENIIQHIELTVDGGVLHTARNIGGYKVVHPLQLRVQLPSLVGVTSTGGSPIIVEGAATASFEVVAGEQGAVTLSGAGGDALVAVLGGGARLDAEGYRVASAALTLGGGSRATIWSTGPVTGAAADTCVVQVKGGGACELTTAPGAFCGPLP